MTPRVGSAMWTRRGRDRGGHMVGKNPSGANPTGHLPVAAGDRSLTSCSRSAAGIRACVAAARVGPDAGAPARGRVIGARRRAALGAALRRPARARLATGDEALGLLAADRARRTPLNGAPAFLRQRRVRIRL